MASADLQKFLEDRLVALDPSIDVSAGSPAQTKFISPVLEYLGTDPFETDIGSFILDRFAQDFPDIYAADPGALSDLFVKPLQLILEPIKREIQTVRRNQSLIDPTLLSDDDADALVANVFDYRDRGGYANGTVRVYFPTPTDVRVEVANRVFDAANQSYFPTSPVSLTSELMSFNREGSLFYMDIPVRAESPGSEYNVDVGQIVGIEGLPNVVKATNLRKFTSGAARQDNVTFVSAAELSLTERSLSNRRGTVARLNTVFKGQLSSVQVVGARDPEMQRDILVASSPGHFWITGRVSLYRDTAMVLARTIDGPVSSVPVVGDTLYFYLSPNVSSDFSSVNPESRLVRVRVEEVLSAEPSLSPSLYPYAYYIRWSDSDGTLERLLGTNFAHFENSLPLEFEGGFSRPGSVNISSMPDYGAVNLTVPNGSVHVYGHADIYIRPTVQTSSSVAINGVYDLGKVGSSSAFPHFFVERTGLVTTADSVTVSEHSLDENGDPTSYFNFLEAGVLAGDVMSIESGTDAGLFNIRAVSATTLSLDKALTASITPPTTVRYRIMRSIRIDPFAPRIYKFPFGDVDPRDLDTNTGSKEVHLENINLLVYNVEAGDTLRILDGDSVGEYTIVQMISGQHIELDRAPAYTESNLNFAVYSSLSPVQRPLVRIKELLLLDSSQQSTGITIPYADPLAVLPTGPLTSATVMGKSQWASGYVLPDLDGLLTSSTGVPLTSHAAPQGIGNDTRYSQQIDTPDGIYLSMAFSNPGNSRSELDFRSDTIGKTSFFLATAETANDEINYPPISPKPGECLSIKTGPNKGDYLIKAVHKFKYLTATSTMYCYFIQIYGTFPVDPIKDLITFIERGGDYTATGLRTSQFPVRFPEHFTDFYARLPTLLGEAMTDAGMTPGADLTALVDSLCACSYEWGTPARGTLRTYHRDPTLFEQRTGTADEVTTFSFNSPTGASIKYRPDPDRYLQTEIIPARFDKDALPTDYPDDLVPAIRIYVSTTANFLVGEWVMGSVAYARPTGKIVAVGADYLVLRYVNGHFEASETITSSGVGTASVINKTGPTLYGVEFLEDTFWTTDSPTTVYAAGVQSGDVLAAYEEVPLFTASGSENRVNILQTTAGSPIVNIPDRGSSFTSGYFTPSMVGGLLRIEEGDDAGTYRIVKVIDPSSVSLDRTLAASTPTVLRTGFVHAFSSAGRVFFGFVSGHGLTTNDIGSYLTFYGIDARCLGSYRITAVTATYFQVTLPFDPDARFHSHLVDVRWAHTATPLVAPTVIVREETHPSDAARGTNTLAGVLFRVYESTPHEAELASVTASASESSMTVVAGTGPKYGRFQPYRIYRPNIRRITPAEMKGNQSGYLYYFDTQVVSLSPSTVANIPTDTYLMPDEGTYSSIGYRHVVTTPSFSYSTEEEGFLDLPLSVMTEQSEDSPGSLISLVGAPIQVSYEQSDLVASVQDFASSTNDRMIAGNLLVRHFLPAYLSYDATYQGGEDPSVIAKDIRTYLEQLPVETSVDVSEIEKLIAGRGGNPDTPTMVIATIHDWNRKMWAELSLDYLGGPESADTKVPYSGTPRVTFFLPGPDVSGQDPLPAGERINLVRR